MDWLSGELDNLKCEVSGCVRFSYNSAYGAYDVLGDVRKALMEIGEAGRKADELAVQGRVDPKEYVAVPLGGTISLDYAATFLKLRPSCNVTI